MAPQDSENCGRDFAKRKQTDADFAANSLQRMVIIDIAINVLLSRVTRHPAGMHCPSWDDAFVSSYYYYSPSKVSFYGALPIRGRITEWCRQSVRPFGLLSIQNGTSQKLKI